MRQKLAFCASAVALFGGCASYESTLAPVPEPGGMPAWVIEGTVAVGADPYVETGRQETVFDGDMRAQGVLPIQVFVRNQGARAVLVRGSDMLLVLADGRQIASAGATTVAARFEDLGGHLGASMAFGIFGLFAAEAAADEAEADRRADYKSKKFHDARLGQNESAHGFVYFIPPSGTPAFTAATLRVQCIDVEEATGLVVNLPIEGLNYSAREEDDDEY